MRVPASFKLKDYGGGNSIQNRKTDCNWEIIQTFQPYTKLRSRLLLAMMARSSQLAAASHKNVRPLHYPNFLSEQNIDEKLVFLLSFILLHPIIFIALGFARFAWRPSWRAKLGERKCFRVIPKPQIFCKPSSNWQILPFDFPHW